ncbi:MAG: ATP-dependent DNA helicase RecG [Clostridia bacterium]|nr:ATP-dependent DNA helicase RecG [Clostridia bacterium]
MTNLSTIEVTAAKEKQFKNKGIESVEDLLKFKPIRYKDYSKITGILPETEMSCIIAKVVSVKTYNRKMFIITATCEEESTKEEIKVTWFNSFWLESRIKSLTGSDVFIAGKVKHDPVYGYSISAPDVFDPTSKGTPKILPVYSKIRGMSNEYLEGKIHAALEINAATEDIYPEEIIEKYKLDSMKETYEKLHFPKTIEETEEARKRLDFNDLIDFAEESINAEDSLMPSSPFAASNVGFLNKIVDSLSFKLTDDQAKVITDILNHQKAHNRINALVQGDVGCGKSIVAFIIMLMFAEAGYQAVLMAPTQVLAKQHYEELKGYADKFEMNAVYLDSSLKASEKKKILKSIKDGSTYLIVGTQSVIGKDVEFDNLALVVVDEEQRFGVEQREKLLEKASMGVHYISMSATPIPRSLAQVVYGEQVQLHTIKTLPKGRKSVITGLSTDRRKMFGFLLKEVRNGHRAYVVCAAIEDNEEAENIRSIEEVNEEFRRVLEPYGVKIGTLTGRDKKEQAEQIINDFKEGRLDVLISTTVIEVGVNVPEATLMIITNAERFGLSTLHQLRGRVGRSSLQSFCVLDSINPSETGTARLQALVDTNDGFEIAKRDLELRGPGDIIGTKQSGLNKKIELMLQYQDEFEDIREIVRSSHSFVI